MKVFTNLNSALIKLSQDILKEGVFRETRGFRCLEFPYPVTVCLLNPLDRYVTIPARKWNKVLPFAELAWLLMGYNDLDVLPGNYVKNLYNFSDNGRTWRAGYGPRIRFMNGFKTDYDIGSKLDGNIVSGYIGMTDQLKYVVDVLNKDPYSRQAVIEIADPVKDNFDEDGNLKVTKDQPCTRLLNFQNRNGALDLTVYMRSNDLIWGFSAVNVFNFTFMLEIVAGMVGLPVGNYYHVANNLHVYEDKMDMVHEIANSGIPKGGSHFYNLKGLTLKKLDSNLEKLHNYEYQLRIGSTTLMPNFEFDLFYDWAGVFYNHYHKENPTSFNNQLIQNLWNR